MASEVFKAPPVNTRNWVDLEKFRENLNFLPKEKKKEFADQQYKRLRERDLLRYIESAKYRCSYCGARFPSLDIDHFYPKGATVHYKGFDSAILSLYEGIYAPVNAEGVPNFTFDDYRSDDGRKNYIERAVDPDNLIPACPFCNTRRRVLMFDGTVSVRGKHDRFPLVDGEEGVRREALLHPGKVTWRTLLEAYAFQDVDDSERVEKLQVHDRGSVRLTLILPRPEGGDPLSQALRVQAAVTIELLGLNRKTLCEGRYQDRRALRAFLGRKEKILCDGFPERDGQAGSEGNIFLETDSFVRKIQKFPQAFRWAVQIKETIAKSSYRLALLDVLREWLNQDGLMSGTQNRKSESEGNNLFDSLDVGRFMG